MSRVRPFLKSFGGKYYLAPWLIEFFPKDYQTYVEVFCGGASVFFNKPPSSNEILNDIDEKTISVFIAIRDHLDEFCHELSSWAYTKENFDRAKEETNLKHSIKSAANEFVLRRMSRSGMKTSFAWSNRLRGGKPGDVNAYESIIANLRQYSERLKDVDIRNCDFRDFFQEDFDDAFFYLDPPYLKETRTSKSVYDYEMTKKDHVSLLKLCNESKHKIMISGYQSPLYVEMLSNWTHRYRPIANHASQRKRKVTKLESIWTNWE